MNTKKTLLTVLLILSSSPALSGVKSLSNIPDSVSSTGQVQKNVMVFCSVGGSHLISKSEKSKKWCLGRNESNCASGKIRMAENVCRAKYTRSANIDKRRQNEPRLNVNISTMKTTENDRHSATLQKINIERDRLSIDQRKLELRKQELELRKQELTLLGSISK